MEVGTNWPPKGGF